MSLQPYCGGFSGYRTSVVVRPLSFWISIVRGPAFEDLSMILDPSPRVTTSISPRSVFFVVDSAPSRFRTSSMVSSADLPVGESPKILVPRDVSLSGSAPPVTTSSASGCPAGFSACPSTASSAAARAPTPATIQPTNSQSAE
jgi:hypothetical protein